MKKVYKSIIVGCFMAALNPLQVKAQLAGTYSVPATFTSLAAAVNSLNVGGITGPVTILIDAGYTETVPVGGLTLTATGTPMNPIVFQKNGPGANPVLTAYGGGAGTPSTAFQDGVFRLVGSDYVTIDGIDINDPNLTNPSTMEFGYGLFKASATDGCQNVTIQNCTITLNRVNNATGSGPAFEGSRGIEMVNAIMGAHTSAVTITSASGANSNNRFYSNTIRNCNIGIALSGYSDASPFANADQNNDVGGAAGSTGNTIVDYGGGGSNAAAGVRTQYQYGLNVAYNTINSNTGAGVLHAGILRGIYAGAATSANASVQNNTITIKGGGTSQSIYGIQNDGGSTAASNTISVLNNLVINSTYTTVSSGSFYGIYNTATPAFLNINNNNISGLTLNPTTGSGALYGFYNASVIGSGLSVSSNTMQNMTGLNTSGSIYGYYMSNSTTNYTVQNNVMNNIGRSNGFGGSFYGYYNFGSPGSSTGYLLNNVFTNLTAGNGANTTYGFYYATLTSHNQVINNNLVSNLSGGTSAIYGIYFSYGNTANSIANNTVTSITGAGVIYGIQHGATSSTSLNVNNNTVGSFTSTGASAVYGIYQSGANTTNTYKNKIYNVSGSNASSTAFGIYINSGSTSNVYNNLVGDIRTPAANAANPLGGIYINGGTTHNIYYNTVYLSGTSTGATFGSSAFYTSTTPNVNLRNNIFINNSVPMGTGLTVAYRRNSNTLTSYSATSNNNLFYAGAPGASNLIFYDGTNALQTMGTYTPFVTPRDANSITENTPFLSLIGNNTNFLHVDPTGNSLTESAASNIAGITDDFDADIRQGNIGYVGQGTAPDVGADEYATILPNCNVVNSASVSPLSSSICVGQTIALNATGFTTGTGIVYQWQVSNVPGGPYSNVVGGLGGNSIAYQTPTLGLGTYYYVMLTTCTISGQSALSVNESTVSVNPYPTVSVTPVTSTICVPGGSSVTLTGAGANTYSWSPAAGLNFTVGMSVQAFPVGTTVYTVTGANLAGCTGTAAATVVISTMPTLTNVAATSTLICPGGSSSLTSVGSLTAYGMASIAYSPVPTPTIGVTTLASGGAQVVPLDNGSLDDGDWENLPIPFAFSMFGVPYSSFAVSTNGFLVLGNGGNPNTYTGYGNAFPSTFAGRPSIGAVYGDLQFGFTGIINTFTTGVAPNRILVVNWSGGNYYTGGGTGTVTSQAVIYETSNFIEVYATQVTGNASAVEGIQNAAGTIAYVVSGRNANTYTVNTPDAYRWTPGSVTYSWGPAAFLNNTAIANPVASNFTASTVYTVNVIGNNGCVNSQTLDLVTDIAPTVAISGGTVPVCDGSTVNLTANGADTYSWTNGPGTASISVTPSVTTAYTVVGTSTLNGCTASAIQNVTINPNPVVVVTGSNAICMGQSVALIATGAQTYTWTNPTNTFAIIAVTPTTTTSYSVSGTSSLGCTGGTTVKTITVYALSGVTVSAAPSKTICEGETITLIASGTGVHTYSWNTGATSAITTATPAVNTSYTLTVGDNSTGCYNTASANIVVKLCVGIEENTGNLVGLNVYPNPNYGQFTVELDNNSEKYIEISDVTGRIILSEKTGRASTEFNINEFANGIYYVKIQSNKAIEVIKIVKQ